MMRVNVPLFPGFGMCANNGINENEAEIVKLFTFKYSVMGKIVRKIKCKKQGNQAVQNKVDYKIERAFNNK
jgi:hypothetical protein